MKMAADQMDLLAKLAAMEKALRDQEDRLNAEKQTRKESELKSKQELQERQMKEYEEKLQLKMEIAAREEKMRREIELRDKELQQERDERKATMELLRVKEDQLTDMINRSSTTSVDGDADDKSEGRPSSSIPDTSGTCPCDCLQRGFPHCVLYPKDQCNCSYSCSFVKEYFADSTRQDHISLRRDVTEKLQLHTSHLNNGHSNDPLDGSLENGQNGRKNGMNSIKPPQAMANGHRQGAQSKPLV